MANPIQDVAEPFTDRTLAYKRNCLIISLVVLGVTLLPSKETIDQLKFFGVTPGPTAVWIALFAILLYFFVMFLFQALPQLRHWIQQNKWVAYLGFWRLIMNIKSGCLPRSSEMRPKFNTFAVETEVSLNVKERIYVRFSKPDGSHTEYRISILQFNYLYSVAFRTMVFDFWLPIVTSALSIVIILQNIFA